MHFFYELKEDQMEIYEKESVHYPPHIHKSMECIYVTRGTLELGVGETLCHMETGDFGIVFPNVIHHYQVFSQEESRAIYFLAPPSFAGRFSEQLLTHRPLAPVIPLERVHPDIPYALERLREMDGIRDERQKETGEQEEPQKTVLRQAFTQVILARTLPFLELRRREEQPGHDIVYDVVVYMAEHYGEEELSLTRMSRDLGYSPFALSRVFSRIFHTNFNQYLNELRLNQALALLQSAEGSITDIAMSAGFTSMRTFNRVFQERFHMPPREYRKKRL